MAPEVTPAGLGNVNLGGDDTIVGGSLDALPVALDVPNGLLHVTIDIEGETRGFGDGETEIKSDNAGDATETDQETPAVVNGPGGVCDDGAVVGVDDDEGDEGGGWKDPRSMPWRSLWGRYRIDIPKLPKP